MELQKSPSVSTKEAAVAHETLDTTQYMCDPHPWALMYKWNFATWASHAQFLPVIEVSGR